MTQTTLKPPTALCKTAKDFFQSVADAYVLEPHHQKLLIEAAWQLHRCEQARAAIAKGGVTAKDRFGIEQPRPEIKIERDAALAYLRLRREMNLDAVPEEIRTPRRGSGRR